jgi:hypothetical protein
VWRSAGTLDCAWSSWPAYVWLWHKVIPIVHLKSHACINIQSDQKVPVHLMITIQKVTSNVQSVPSQSPDIYWH